MLHGARDPWLGRYYAFHWSLIGNLGTDLLMVVLGPLLGVERAAHVLAALIPPLTIGGIYVLARGARREAPSAAAFLALPLVYARPLTLGFTNFCLAQALAFWVAAGWRRIALRGPAVRWAYAGSCGLLVWLTHVGGWALLIVLVGAQELVRSWRDWRSAIGALWEAGLRTLPFALALLPTLLWRAGGVPDAAEGHEYLFGLKLLWLRMLFRGEAWGPDLMTTAALLGAAVIIAGLCVARRIRLRPDLAVAAVALLLLFLALPQWLFGSYYADMRLLPPALILLFASVRPLSAPVGRLVGTLGLALFAAQVGATARGWHVRAGEVERDLAVLDRVPRGSRIATFAYRSDCPGWTPSTLEHVPSLAIVRRSAFVNSEFAYAGQNLMSPIYNLGRDFNGVPSNLIARREEPCGGRPLPAMLAALPRDRFDFVWIFEALPPADMAWLRPVAAGPHGRLYRIVRG
jgi:hypothetical protein